jgi:hypothetical protein
MTETAIAIQRSFRLWSKSQTFCRCAKMKHVTLDACVSSTLLSTRLARYRKVVDIRRTNSRTLKMKTTSTLFTNKTADDDEGNHATTCGVTQRLVFDSLLLSSSL